MAAEHPWRVGPVTGAVDRTLDAWSVYEVSQAGPDGPWTAHVSGFSREGCKGRASTSIIRFDLEARRVLTTSGRVYELAGRPGVNGDAFAVWGSWKHRNGVRAERDVTMVVVEEMLAAGAPAGE